MYKDLAEKFLKSRGFLTRDQEQRVQSMILEFASYLDRREKRLRREGRYE